MTDTPPSALFTKHAALVRAWQRAATVAAFCAETGLTSRAASNWAAGQRRHLVPLKHMPRLFNPCNRGLNAAERQELIAVCLRENDAIEAEAVRRRCLEDYRR